MTTRTDSPPAPRRSRRLRRVAALLVLAAVALVLVVDGLRWRVQLVGLKAAGQIPGMEWGEMLPLLRPRSQVYLRSVVASRSPYHSIVNPWIGSSDVAAGREAFLSRCAGCHGGQAEGGAAPALVGRSLRHGEGDWALYRTLTRGIPGTTMMPAGLDHRRTWQVVAYLQTLRYSGKSVASGPGKSDSLLRTMPPVPAAALIGARSTPENWLTYSGSYDSWRYSPLSEITRDNVSRLKLLWMHQFSDPELRFESSPLVVGGVMFVTSPLGRIQALDAGTGVIRWTFERALPDTPSLCCGRVNRGLGLLDSTLYHATLDAHLLAIDARTGRLRWDVEAARVSEGYSFTSAPLAVRDLVVIGSAGGEYATSGFIDAYDASTGARRWRFRTIPGPGEPGHETWAGESWQTGGGPAWLTGSYDPELDLIYWGIGNPNPDFDGSGRAGDNLFTNSVVALDRATGAKRWHFQFTPHDVHDWDAAQIPVLVDLAGRRLLLWANRNGFFYVLDRETGRFLRGSAFAHQTWSEGLDSAGRPVVRPGSAPTREGTLVWPGVAGATNWWSPSYSPRTGFLYVPSLHRSSMYFVSADHDKARTLYRMGGGTVKPPAAAGRIAIRALDPAGGTVRWEHVLADSVASENEFVGGLLSTAGNLLFGGADDLLVALDGETGRRLWSFRTGQGVHAAPITYLVGGRQQFTINAGRTLLTFGLERPLP
jgi:alcohol dehydrogenase (cytochrome c)